MRFFLRKSGAIALGLNLLEFAALLKLFQQQLGLFLRLLDHRHELLPLFVRDLQVFPNLPLPKPLPLQLQLAQAFALAFVEGFLPPRTTGG